MSLCWRHPAGVGPSRWRISQPPPHQTRRDKRSLRLSPLATGPPAVPGHQPYRHGESGGRASALSRAEVKPVYTEARERERERDGCYIEMKWPDRGVGVRGGGLVWPGPWQSSSGSHLGSVRGGGGAVCPHTLTLIPPPPFSTASHTTAVEQIQPHLQLEDHNHLNQQSTINKNKSRTAEHFGGTLCFPASMPGYRP